MGPQNGIVGQENPTQLPQAAQDDSQLKAMAKTAKFMRTQEYKELKEHFDKRIEFYQKYLPDGRAVGANGSMMQSGVEGLSMAEMGAMWVAANVIIGELKAVMGAYEAAAEFVKEAKAQANAASNG